MLLVLAKPTGSAGTFENSMIMLPGLKTVSHIIIIYVVAIDKFTYLIRNQLATGLFFLSNEL